MGSHEAWRWEKREWALLANFLQYMRYLVVFLVSAFAKKNPLVKLPMDETPRTASCREGTKETAISTSGMGRRHPGTIVTFCRRSAQERTIGGRHSCFIILLCFMPHLVVYFALAFLTCISY
jgi:hypothetical protein